MVEHDTNPTIVGLLQQLRSQLHKKDTKTLQLPINLLYEKLLNHISEPDPEACLHQNLINIHNILSKQVDFFHMSKQFEDTVNRCFEISAIDKEFTIPIIEAMRMLVILSGGSDGQSFNVKNSNMVNYHSNSHWNASTGTPNFGTYDRPKDTLRIGEQIRMDNIDVVLHGKTLFQAESIPLLERHTLNKVSLFKSLKQPMIGNRNLWYHEDNTSELIPQKSVDFKEISAQPSSSFNPFSLGNTQDRVNKPLSYHEPINLFGHLTDSSINNNNTNHEKKRHGEFLIQEDEDTVEVMPQLSIIHSDAVFFDASQMKQPYLTNDHLDKQSAIIQILNTKCNASVEQTFNSWYPNINCQIEWDERLHYASSWDILNKNKRNSLLMNSTSLDSLNQLPLGNLEDDSICISEENVLEDIMNALIGVESILFRICKNTASIQPPLRKIHLSGTSSLSFISAVEDVCNIGTIALRIEYLGIYYSQDAARGGKTLHALGCALCDYLSQYRKLLQNTTAHCSTLISMLTNTKKITQQLKLVGEILGLDVTQSFWPLLASKQFPRGIELLDLLYKKMKQMEELNFCPTHSHQNSTKTIIFWLFAKSAEPFLTLVSEYLNSGAVSLTNDVFGEFELAKWIQAQLYNHSATKSVDSSWKHDLDNNMRSFWEELHPNNKTNLFPMFLHDIAYEIVYIGQLQALLKKSYDLYRSIAIGRAGIKLAEIHLGISLSLDRASHLFEIYQNQLKEFVLAITNLADKPSAHANEIVYNSQMSIPFGLEREDLGQAQMTTVSNEIAGEESCAAPTNQSLADSSTSVSRHFETFSLQNLVRAMEGNNQSAMNLRIQSASTDLIKSFATPENDDLHNIFSHDFDDRTSFLPSRILIESSIHYPVRYLLSSLNPIVKNLCLKKFDLDIHVEWLHRLMLMSDGLSMDIFARDILVHVLGPSSSLVTRASWAINSSRKLSEALALAIIDSRGVVKQDNNDKNMELPATYQYLATPIFSELLAQKHAGVITNVWEFVSEFSLSLPISFPLNIVLTPKSTEMYSKIHRFLLYTRLTSLCVKDMLFMTRLKARTHNKIEAAKQSVKTMSVAADCALFIQSIHMVLTSFSDTFETIILMEGFKSMKTQFRQVNGILDLRQIHEAFVDTALKCCFIPYENEMVQNEISIHDIILGILQRTWMLYAIFINNNYNLTEATALEAYSLCVTQHESVTYLVHSLKEFAESNENDPFQRKVCKQWGLRLDYNDFLLASNS